MSKGSAELINDCIRNGDISKARSLLADLKLKQIPNDQRVVFASLARRARLFRLSLKILNPVIHPKYAGSRQGTAEELIEYASSLRGIGAGQLSFQYLEGLDRDRYPERLLHQSFCLFMSWEYSRALPLLLEYVENKNISEYQRLIGEVNLASTYISCEKGDKAKELLEQLLLKTKDSDYSLLNLNCRELMAQVFIKSFGDYEKARQILNEAGRELNLDSGEISTLFVRKWLAVSESLIEKKVTPMMVQVRKEALRLRHWETVRDLDYYIGVIEKDEAALLELYFSTPFTLIQNRIKQNLKGTTLPEFFELGDVRAKKIIHLETGEWLGGESCFPLGSILHRLLIVLMKDRYKPMPMAEIYTNIYEGEVFDPMTSLNRVVQLISRLRRQIKKMKIPMEIIEYEGRYFLELKPGVKVRKNLEPLPDCALSLKLRILRKRLNSTAFESSQVEEVLNASRSSVQRFLSRAEENGQVQLIQSGRTSHYKFVA